MGGRGMRTIKFRGKNKYGKWIKGDLIHNRGKVYIAPHGIQNPFAQPENFEVDELTVGQYTGFSDKNGVEIYENDFIQDDQGTYEILWSNYSSAYMVRIVNSEDNVRSYLLGAIDYKETVVVGNIFDNKNLKESAD
jgi:uncharacterized phage protein (TIGR01671 family)